MFYNKGDRDKANETGLKKRGGIEVSTTVLSIYAMHALFALNTYLSSSLEDVEDDEEEEEEFFIESPEPRPFSSPITSYNLTKF